MKFRTRGALIALLCLTARPASAIDPGFASGTLTIDGREIELKFAAAVLKENDEGLLERDPELRIFVSDREIDNDALAGIVFLPVEFMARQGKVSGLLVRVQPNDLETVIVSLHAPDADELSLSSGHGLNKLSVGNNRASGSLEASAGPLSFSVTFSAPLFYEPEITSDLKGNDARRSPQIVVARKRARALGNGDLDEVLALSTDRARDRLKALYDNPDIKDPQKRHEASEQLEKEAMRVRRVVVRGRRAVAVFSDHRWMSFELVDGEWLVDD